MQKFSVTEACGTAMTVNTIQALIDAGREHEFYTSHTWRLKAEAVKRRDNYECQLCKARGRYRRGEIVHHVKHLKARPDLALMEIDPDTGERQLVTVCKRCHEDEHPEAMAVRMKTDAKGYCNEERWE